MKDCIEHNKSLNRSGYGQIRKGSRVDGSRKLWLAHRWAWAEKNGPIPDDMCVLHRCDNRSCINTDHLFLGTQADNIKDMMKKGRHYSPTHCPKGHEYLPDNIYWHGNRRSCKQCKGFKGNWEWKHKNQKPLSG